VVDMRSSSEDVVTKDTGIGIGMSELKEELFEANRNVRS
jgi:hypothetical protein